MSKIMNCLFIPAVSLMAAGCCSKSGAPAIAQDSEIEKQVEEILADMTLEEKVGLVFGFKSGGLPLGPKRRDNIGWPKFKVRRANCPDKPHLDYVNWGWAVVMLQHFLKFIITNIVILTFHF